MLLTDSALAEHADAIRALRSRIVKDVAEIGRRLAAVKVAVGHGNWLPWLDREFGWSEDTAERFIRVHEFVERLSDSASVRNLILTFPISSVYLLAAPSTPKTARDEIIARAKAGEALSVAEVRRLIAEAKEPAREQIARDLMDIGNELYDQSRVITEVAENLWDAGDDEEEPEPEPEPSPESQPESEPDDFTRRYFQEREDRRQERKELRKRFADFEQGRITANELMGWPPSAHDDIGPNSTGENDRLRARIDELSAENRRLEIEAVGLRREIEDKDRVIAAMRVANDRLANSLADAMRKLGMPNAFLPEREAAPPADDGSYRTFPPSSIDGPCHEQAHRRHQRETLRALGGDQARREATSLGQPLSRALDLPVHRLRNTTQRHRNEPAYRCLDFLRVH
jgi:hypothetical protein